MNRAILPAALCLTALAVAVSPARADDLGKFPRIKAALVELQEARNDLKGPKGGVRPKQKAAADAITEAIKSLKLALDVKGDDFKGTPRGKDDLKKYKDHPRVRSALDSLRDARKDLSEARSTFRGHKKQAIADVDKAIGELEALLK